MGRRRQYCRQSCRQRAYEQRALVKGSAIPEDAVVLSADEAAELSDRVFQVRCAAEDVATAVDEGAAAAELRDLCDALVRAAKLPTAGVDTSDLFLVTANLTLIAAVGRS